MRTVRLSPYRKGCGPVFTLSTWWDFHRFDCGGGVQKERLAYRLTMREHGKSVVVFQANDCGVAPSDSVDGDASLRALLGFLCLKPGDTDREYFKDYTPAQLAFANAHGEALACETFDRFGED